MVEAESDWWRTWFGPEYLKLYDTFLAERTPGEIDQLEWLLNLKPPIRILDLPCGQGRHSIELARRGYEVTGVDLSESMLAVARERGRAGGVSVTFQLGDMREPLQGDRFDLVLNLFTSLGYFADAADDRRVVEAALRMLTADGRFVLEVLNGERVMNNFQEREWFTVGDAAVMERRSLDRPSRRLTVERTVTRTGEEETSIHVIRLYGRPEISALLASAGFGRVELFGDWDGSRASPDALRVLAVATR